jgi:hypothetical protein
MSALTGAFLLTVACTTGTSGGQANASGAAPTLTITRYDTNTVVVAGDRYPARASVTLAAKLTNADGSAYAGGGSVLANSPGHFLAGFLLPRASGVTGTLRVTATAAGVAAQSASLGVGAPAEGPRLPPAPKRTLLKAPAGGLMRGGTTDLSNTTAYPNSPLIPGPLPIPAGGVQIPAGANIQSYIDSNPTGTQFDLAAGTYSGPGVLLPKAGDRFYGLRAGPGGTLLAGLGIHRPNGSATGVEIHNLSITGFSDSGGNGAVDSDMHESDAASGWVLTNSEIYGNYLGASLGPNSLVENNTFHDNACKAAAGGMTGTIWRYNQFIHNRLPSVSDPGGDCAGVKVTVEKNNQFIGNLFSDNGHPAGLWMDVSCDGDTFTDNISYGNDGSGFADETGLGNTFKNNIAAGNGQHTPDSWRRTGIVMESSANDSAIGNFAWGNNGPGITVYAENRHDAQGDARNANNSVAGNTIDNRPSIVMVNINSPQNIGSNAIMGTGGMRVPLLKAGPQM